MLIGGLFLIFMFLLILGIAKVRNYDDWPDFCIVFGATFLLFLVPTVLATYVNNGASLARWQTFYDTNVANYAITVDKTAVYLSTSDFENKMVAGSVEKLQQAGYVSERIKEWRDSINEYNSTIASMRYLRSSWLLGGIFVIPPIPSGLIPLRIN